MWVRVGDSVSNELKQGREIGQYQGAHADMLPLAEDEISLVDLWLVLVTRRWIVFGIAALVAIGALVLCAG